MFLFFLCQFDGLAVSDDFSEDGQVKVEEFPGGLKDEVDALFAVVDEIAEEHSQALENVPLDVEISLRVALYDLNKKCHPCVEGLIQALLHQLII